MAKLRNSKPWKSSPWKPRLRHVTPVSRASKTPGGTQLVRSELLAVPVTVVPEPRATPAEVMVSLRGHADSIRSSMRAPRPRPVPVIPARPARPERIYSIREKLRRWKNSMVGNTDCF